MSTKRPVLLEGWLGGQPKFSELRMSVHSHKGPEFNLIGDKDVKITMKTGIPVKLVTKLINASKKDKNCDEYVLAQRRDKEEIIFDLGFPENGFYKFQIFALEETNRSEDLPNVYNYLIDVDRIHQPAQPLVKALTRFYDEYCFLEEPLALYNLTPNLDNVKFRIFVPGAVNVAVNCAGEWNHLTKNRHEWEGYVDLAKNIKGRNTKVSVGANFDNSNNYSVLLEYTI